MRESRAMTDPEESDRLPRPPLPSGGHGDRPRAEQLAEASAMVALWERTVSRRRNPRAKEEPAFWRGVREELEAPPEP